MSIVVLTIVVLGGIPLTRYVSDALEDRRGPTDLRVELRVRVVGGSWLQETWVEPGEMVEYLITIENLGPQTARDVVVGFNKAPYQAFVKNSVRLSNSSHPDGITIRDRPEGLGGQHLLHGGINIGHYRPGANGHVYWFMRVTDSFEEPGKYVLTSVGIADALGNEGAPIQDDTVVRVDAR